MATSSCLFGLLLVGLMCARAWGRSIKARRLERVVESRPQPILPSLERSSEKLTLPSNEDADALLVPPPLRNEGDSIDNHITFYAWNDLFGAKLRFSETFNSNAQFRTALRIAARRDFTSEGASTFLVNDLRNSLSGNWLLKNCEKRSFSYTTQVLVQNFPASALDGTAFFDRLFQLCPETPHRFCSWMDIVGIVGRSIAHSWHQDSGRNQRTAMIGFPPCDSYKGIGVFSHAVKLSHRLRDPPAEHNEPRLWEHTLLPSVEEEEIVRPAYIPFKQELMTYDDCDVFHSAPDWAHRESVWRLM